MSNFERMLFVVMEFVRYAGIIVITIAGMVTLVTEGVRNKLSPTKVFGVAASAVVAAVLFWLLPDLVNYARSDSHSIVPEHPVGSYQ